MHTLIIAIITIVLMGSVLYGGINYLNFSSYENRIFETVLVNDLYSYEMAINSHYNMYNYYPETSNVESELDKIKILKPIADIGSYSYLNEQSSNSVGVCYSVNARKDEMQVIEKIKEQGGFIVASSCFEKINSVVDDGTYPKQVAITKWIKF